MSCYDETMCPMSCEMMASDPDLGATYMAMLTCTAQMGVSDFDCYPASEPPPPSPRPAANGPCQTEVCAYASALADLYGPVPTYDYCN